MSREVFQEGCKGCEPCAIDVETGQRLTADHPVMMAMMRVWRTLSLAEKQAWHEVTCQNSREPQTLAVASRIVQRFQSEIKATEK